VLATVAATIAMHPAAKTLAKMATLRAVIVEKENGRGMSKFWKETLFFRRSFPASCLLESMFCL
jgi:hypothetical protein